MINDIAPKIDVTEYYIITVFTTIKWRHRNLI